MSAASGEAWQDADMSIFGPEPPGTEEESNRALRWAIVRVIWRMFLWLIALPFALLVLFVVIVNSIY